MKGKGEMVTYFLKSSQKFSMWEIIERPRGKPLWIGRLVRGECKIASTDCCALRNVLQKAPAFSDRYYKCSLCKYYNLQHLQVVKLAILPNLQLVPSNKLRVAIMRNSRHALSFLDTAVNSIDGFSELNEGIEEDLKAKVGPSSKACSVM